MGMAVPEAKWLESRQIVAGELRVRSALIETYLTHTSPRVVLVEVSLCLGPRWINQP